MAAADAVRGLRASLRPARGGRRPVQRPLEYRMLVTATLCLLAFGAVMVYSASSAKDLLQGSGNGSGYLAKYVIFGAIGLVVMHLLARLDLDAVRRVTPMLLAAAMVLVVCVRLPGLGVEVNGAKRWLGAGPLVFQPSELLKVALVLYAARLIAENPERVRRSVKDLVRPLLLVIGLGAGLVAMQPDLGTALVIAFTAAAILIVAGVPLRHLAVIGGAALLLVGIFALLEPYRRARLTSFLDPWDHASGAGFQAVQGQIAIGSGGLFGVGIGESVQKVFYLPEAHTDFILAVIGEELGLAGVGGVIFLYGMIAWAGLRTARAARGVYAKMLAAGLTSLILCQAALNVFAVFGLAPLTGVPLPFISYGGTTLIVLLGVMGLLLNVAAGGSAHLREVRPPARRAEAARGRPLPPRDADEDRDRRRRNRGARGARAGRRGRAAG
jgi:cell division protein FtsW